MLAGWIENPIKSKVLTFPIDKIVFPTVTLCPQDSRPDRWGTVIKIFDQLNTDCGSKRLHSCSIQNPIRLLWTLLKIWERKKNNFHTNNSFQVRAILRDFYPLFIFLSKKETTFLWKLTVEWGWKKRKYNTKGSCLMRLSLVQISYCSFSKLSKNIYLMPF